MTAIILDWQIIPLKISQIMHIVWEHFILSQGDFNFYRIFYYVEF